MPHYQFPADFVWGCASASYQIEGAADEDGRAPSIWDTFCDQPGAIKTGDSGRMACDHYHRWREDLDLIQRLGFRAYRFSIAWPRVIPMGRGAVNAPGLDWYDRLVDGLLERGITPWATCYHWDLPQALEDAGGWRERATAEAFAEYCGVVAARLGDRIERWMSLNEPWCSWALGHITGISAPGRQDSEPVHRQVAHHLLLAHGLGARALRAAAPRPIKVGIVHNAHVPQPFSEREEDVALARRWFQEKNGWLLEPIFNGRYPDHDHSGPVTARPKIAPGDMETIAAPCDFHGCNLYHMPDVAWAEAGGALREREPWFPRTDFGWPLTPDLLYWGARFTHELYAPGDLYITENGCCYPDAVNADGRVEDYARVEYLRQHFKGMHRAIAEGLPLRGHFVWTIMDNFEWAEGFSRRFGIVHVNFHTQRRTPKASAHWLSRVIADGGF